MTCRKVDLLEKVAAFQGYFRIDRYRLRHETFDGGMTGDVVRELFERGHAAAVLPYDPVRDEVVLQEQFRIGAYAAGHEPWLIEIVAGIIEDGETAENVARREILEETGLCAIEMVPVVETLVSPGGTSESVRIYCARVDSSEAGGVFGLASEGEDIRTFTVPASEVADLLDSGRIANAVALIALQWFVLNRNRIRDRWSG
ncbi:MAG: NUDIX domain-containing protein [Alphaproteobacteria bacterium]|nr:NUDIX domain-containing protein [Alphaproteobacteria bacterium]